MALSLELIPYRTKVYGEREDVFCHLENPIENIACLAHDAAMGEKSILGGEAQTKAAMAIELANIIQNTASSARNSLYNHVNKPNISTHESELCLTNYYGICGNHQDLFKMAALFLDIKTRIVSIYYLDKNNHRHSHATSEFLLDGKWRFIDTTWNSFWLANPENISSILSFKEIIEQKKRRPTYSNHSNLWLYSSTLYGLDVFDYLDAKQYYLIQKGGKGTLKLHLDYPIEDFNNIPNYIGSDGPDNELTLYITLPKGQTGTFNFQISGTACVETHVILESENFKQVLHQGKNYVKLVDKQTLRIKHSPGKICYAVLDKIERVKAISSSHI